MIIENYNRWLSKTSGDIHDELESVRGDEAAVSDRFYRLLSFGTGGLRGVIGAGTNRMNIHTVALAAQALAEWLSYTGIVAVAYDSRIKSELFAHTAAAVLAVNGISVHIFRELQPTPALSYAVRELNCSAGVVITASHNPAEYNGFKCYGSDGCQITDKAASEIEACMNRLDIFEDVKRGSFGEYVKQGRIQYIGDDLLESYLKAVRSCQVEPEAARKAGLRVVYTPLCGAGSRPVRELLSRTGCEVTMVTSQELPDGSFPGCPKPNPEIREAFNAALELADGMSDKPELLLATDPDCDRVGAAVLNNNEYTLMTGNEIGALMLDYILTRRKANRTLPANPIAIKTIVTSAITDKICAEHGCELRVCLTGFKYIGEIITALEAEGSENRFILGFEESYGYLAGSYARDKDAVFGSMLICEMAAYYKLQGYSLLEAMRRLNEKYGFYVTAQINADFEGEMGMKRINAIMTELRENRPAEIAGVNVVGYRDYLADESKLPKSNVIEFICADASILTARPSGTEPKIKFYLTAAGASLEISRQRIDALTSFVSARTV